MLIHIARSISPAEGSVQIPGGIFEVRWGILAVSKSMTTVPHTEMLQVNIKTDKSRIVKATGSSQSKGFAVDDEDDVVFAHLSPNGIPVEYSEVVSNIIRLAIKRDGEGGGKALLGGDLEVRWGTEATCEPRFPFVPPSGMIQVHTATGDARLVLKIPRHHKPIGLASGTRAAAKGHKNFVWEYETRDGSFESFDEETTAALNSMWADGAGGRKVCFLLESDIDPLPPEIESPVSRMPVQRATSSLETVSIGALVGQRLVKAAERVKRIVSGVRSSYVVPTVDDDANDVRKPNFEVNLETMKQTNLGTGRIRNVRKRFAERDDLQAAAVDEELLTEREFEKSKSRALGLSDTNFMSANRASIVHSASTIHGDCWVCVGSGRVSSELPKDFDHEAALEKEANDEFVCSVCYDEGMVGVSSSCGKHYFCAKCAKGSLEAARELGQLPVYCPMCRADWPAGTTEKNTKVGRMDGIAMAFLVQEGVLAEDAAQRLLRLHNKSIGTNEPVCLTCSNKSCSRYLALQSSSYPGSLEPHGGDRYCYAGQFYNADDPSAHNMGDFDKLKVSLAACECGMTYCIRCFTKATVHHRCLNLDNGVDDELALTLIKKTIVCGKSCPACGQFLEKNEGCDVFMCGTNAHGDMNMVLRRGTGCGHEFDWNTMKPLRNGRPGQPANDKQILFMDANDPRRQKTHISIEEAVQLGFIDATEYHSLATRGDGLLEVSAMELKKRTGAD